MVTEEMIRDYKEYVARFAADVLHVDIRTVRKVMINKGINAIIDQDPEMDMHYGADDWVEPIAHHLGVECPKKYKRYA